MVTIKMKVAAVSAATSWGLVLAFLCLWLRFWANLNSSGPFRRAFSQLYGDSQYLQWSIVTLSILAGISITWRFLVSGLWIGLAGNRKLFAATAIPYGLAPLGLIIPFVLMRSESPLRIWIRQNPEWLLSSLLWVTALAVFARFLITVFCWRGTPREYSRLVLGIWFAGTLGLVAMANLIWMALRLLLPVDAGQLRALLILIALLAMPLVRLGLAPLFLARNRHR